MEASNGSRYFGDFGSSPSCAYRSDDIAVDTLCHYLFGSPSRNTAVCSCHHDLLLVRILVHLYRSLLLLFESPFPHDLIIASCEISVKLTFVLLVDLVYRHLLESLRVLLLNELALVVKHVVSEIEALVCDVVVARRVLHHAVHRGVATQPFCGLSAFLFPLLLLSLE